MRIRLHTFAVILLAAATVGLVACGGDDEPEPPFPTPTTAPSTPVPSATPLAQVPEPTIVTGPGEVSSTPVDPTEVSYVVVAGDALSLIADRFGVSVDVIRQANNLSGDDIFIGQVLRIPRQAATPGATPTPAPGSPDTYTVQPGDTAFGIALQFDVTLQALEQANGVGPGGLDNLQIGQVLQIPRAP
jgi:LysM repeat protein